MTRRSLLSLLSVGSGTLLSFPAIAGGSDRNSWQPDGLGYRARIGLLTPNDDAVPESEFWTMAPEGVSVHVSRVLLVDTRKFADPPHPDDATALLAATGSGYVIACYIAFCAVTSIIATLLMPDYTNRDISQEHA